MWTEQFKRQKNNPKNKFSAKKYTIGDKTFHSKWEADRYVELLAKQARKEISNLRTQIRFELQPGFEIDGKKILPIYYFADFVYEQDGKTIVEDTKGFKDKVYEIKRKMFCWRYKKDYVFKETYRDSSKNTVNLQGKQNAKINSRTKSRKVHQSS